MEDIGAKILVGDHQVQYGPNQRTKIKALVVDDNMINQALHRRLLHNLGIENHVVGNGREAVDVHCSGRRFDLILMDLDMPVMNGIEVYKSCP